MKLAAISDIHGNLPALDAVLADIATQGVDMIVNLGDILSGPLWSAVTAERLMELDLPTIAGNHERQVLTQPRDRMSAADAHTFDEIDARHRAWLASLPPTLALEETHARPKFSQPARGAAAAKRRSGDAVSPEVFCCHGTPTSDLAYFLETTVAGFAGVSGGANGVRAATCAEATERAGPALQGVAHGLILCGHTHMPRVLRLADGRLVVNPGSVGLQGFDDDHGHPHIIETGAPHARYALLDRGPAGWSVALRAVAYDWEAAAQRAEREQRPDWADTLRTGFVGRLEGAGPRPAPPRPRR